MTLRERIKQPKVLISIGLWCLILGALSLRFLRRITGMTEDVADGLTGLLYGLSIGCMLIGIRLNARRRTGKDGSACV
jgi:hypothetical protein